MAPRAGGFLLLPAAIALLLASSPMVVGYGERVFDENPTLSSSTLPVSATERVAQSFATGESFVLSLVSLHVQNSPPQGDALNVTVQTDAGGSPSGVVLAYAEIVRSGSGWKDFPIAPNATISAGTTYWIVAANAAPAGDGYVWTHSDADVVGGEAKADSGSGWTAAGTDMAYMLFGIGFEPDVEVGLSADRAWVDAGGRVNYTIYLNNSGLGVPQGASVQLTLPEGLAYESDTAAASGGARTGASSWSFPNLTNGEHAFSVIARVGSPPSSYLNATVRLDYTDVDGDPLPSESAQVTVRSTYVVEQTDAWLRTLLPFIVLAAVAAPAGYLFWRSRRPRIEEVFVIHRGGTLLHHVSRSMRSTEDVDTDSLGGMLTVLQAFVKDSFRFGANRDLRKVEFGDYTIQIVSGRDVFVAVASTRDLGDISAKLRRIVDEIEERYGVALANFRGRMEAVVGIRDIVHKLFRRG